MLLVGQQEEDSACKYVSKSCGLLSRGEVYKGKESGQVARWKPHLHAGRRSQVTDLIHCREVGWDESCID